MGRVYRALLLAAAILAPGLAAAQPDTQPAAPPVIIRGSSSAEAAGSGSSGSRLVLRGTPPPVPPPAPIYTCPPGYLPDPSRGCVPPGLAYAPSEVDYWPYIWPYYAYALPRRLGRAAPMDRFARHVVRLGPAERFAHR